MNSSKYNIMKYTLGVMIIIVFMLLLVTVFMKKGFSKKEIETNILELENAIELQAVNNVFEKNNNGFYLFDFTNKNSNYNTLNINIKENFSGIVEYNGQMFLYKEFKNGKFVVNTDENGNKTINKKDNSFSIIFMSDDDILEIKKVGNGSVITPPKARDKDTYTFLGWYYNNQKYDFTKPINEDLVLYSKYQKSSYSVVFKNDDGKILSSEQVEYGVVPTYKGLIPTKNATDEYVYEFSGWNKLIDSITQDEVYYAVYKEIKNKYIVTFKNENGKVLQKKEFSYGEKPKYTGKTPTKSASVEYTYKFSGWNKELSEVTADTEYIATYKSSTRSYNVSFVNGNSYVDKKTIKYNNKVSAPVSPTKVGYTFKYWSTSNDGWAYNFNTNITKDTTLYAVFEPNKYNITFYNDGGIYYKEAVSYSNYANRPMDPYKENYNFAGWIIKGTNEVFNFLTPITKDLELVSAYTTKPVFIVNFVNGYDVKTVEVKQGDIVKKPTDPIKIGYVFEGWFDQAGIKYNFNTKINSNITLTARFTEKPHYVTFISEDIEFGEKQKVLDGNKLIKLNTNPTKEGHTFKHWSLSKNGEEFNYNTEIKKDLTLYAVYEINEYDVEFRFDNDYLIESATVTYDTTVNSILAPTKEGYTFKYWSLSKNGEEFDFETPIKDNTILYAVYEVNKYKVTFKVLNEDGNYIDSDVFVEYNSAVEIPSPPEKDGYTFEAWTTDIEGNNIYDFDTLVTEDIILYAYFREKIYTVKFVGDDTESTVKVAHGNSVEAPVTDKECYTFKYWSLDPEGQNEFNLVIPITSDEITLYANYDSSKCTITFQANDLMENVSLNQYNPSYSAETGIFTIDKVNKGIYIPVNLKDNYIYNLEYTMESVEGSLESIAGTLNGVTNEVFKIDGYIQNFKNESGIYSPYNYANQNIQDNNLNIQHSISYQFQSIGPSVTKVYIEPNKNIDELVKVKISNVHLYEKYITKTKFNETITKPDIIPEKEGYRFLYWSLSESGEEFDFSSNITTNTTLYAVYEEFSVKSITNEEGIVNLN